MSDKLHSLSVNHLSTNLQVDLPASCFALLHDRLDKRLPHCQLLIVVAYLKVKATFHRQLQQQGQGQASSQCGRIK